MPTTKNAGPRGRGTGVKLADETTASVPPRGRAYAGPPVPGRRLWLVVVLSCPRCGAMHQHRVYEASRLLAGRVTRCCPATGRPYVLAPVQRRREAVRRAA